MVLAAVNDGATLNVAPAKGLAHGGAKATSQSARFDSRDPASDGSTSEWESASDGMASAPVALPAGVELNPDNPLGHRAVLAKHAARTVPEFEMPRAASVATLHFAEEKARKAEEIEAARAQTKGKAPVEPLPVDHITKLGEAQMAEKARQSKELAEQEMPIGVKYFTELAKVEEAQRLAAQRELSEAEMPEAVRHFKRLEAEKASSVSGGEAEVMPAAIQHFTMAEMEEKARKRASLQALHENPPPMAPGTEYFTSKMREENERKRAEREAMKENPPPASVATEYFNKRESQRKLEIEQMQNEPAPPAIEYFTQKAKADAEASKRALEASSANNAEPPVATTYFKELEKKRAAEIEAARASTRSKAPVEPLPVDHFTKENDAIMAEKARASKALAEKEMPIGVKYFTELGKEEEAQRLAAQRELSEAEMSAATRHFKELEMQKKANASGGEAEIMPAAIQHFTAVDRAEKEKKRASLRELHENPPPMAPGTAYFTEKDREEKAKRAAELEAMKENPPPASAATEYFKVKEEERKAEIEAQMNEPAPVAIEYFTQKAKDEAEASKRALEASSANNAEPAAATVHFQEMEKKKAAEIEANRQKVREMMKNPGERPKVDWANLTKQKAPVVPEY